MISDFLESLFPSLDKELEKRRKYSICDLFELYEGWYLVLDDWYSSIGCVCLKKGFLGHQPGEPVTFEYSELPNIPKDQKFPNIIDINSISVSLRMSDRPIRIFNKIYEKNGFRYIAWPHGDSYRGIDISDINTGKLVSKPRIYSV